MAQLHNVLLVHNYYRIPGGEDTVVANEKALLEEHGHKVVTYFRRNEEISSLPLWRKVLLPFTSIFSLRTYREVRSIIRREKIDVVHVHNWLALVSPAVYYAALSCGVPVVQTAHNYRLQCPEGSFFRRGSICTDCVQHGLRCSLRHRCYRNSFVQTLVCVLSLRIHRLTGIYRKLHYVCMTGFNRRKLEEANEAAGKELFCPQRMHEKPHFTFADTASAPAAEPGTYLFIGRVERIKGMQVLIDAFSRMPERHLVVAGTGTAYEEYVAEAAERGCSNISFVGFQNREQLRALRARSKAVIVPSQYYEPFGMVIIEAYAQGLPVLAGRVGGFPLLVREGKTGLLFTYDSAEALCAAVQQFESAEGVDWAAETRAEYEANYTPEANYRRLLAIYDAAVADVAPPRAD